MCYMSCSKHRVRSTPTQLTMMRASRRQQTLSVPYIEVEPQVFQDLFPLPFCRLSYGVKFRRPRRNLPVVPGLHVHVPAHVHDRPRAGRKQLPHEHLVPCLRSGSTTNVVWSGGSRQQSRRSTWRHRRGRRLFFRVRSAPRCMWRGGSSKLRVDACNLDEMQRGAESEKPGAAAAAVA